jgi:protein O-mannosyl-transferase
MYRPEMKANPAPLNISVLGVARARFPVWLMVGLLALVTMALYWQTTRCDFVNYDDPDYVTANPHVQGGLTWAKVKWAFGNTEQAAYWAPFMWLSHMLACQLFGLNPWGHHLINVLLHAANTVLVFLLFRRMTGTIWHSFFVAALFGWHPLRVESVAWITERKDVLSTCFGLLALWAYVQYVEKSNVQSPRSKVFYGLGLLFFVLGLMSKAILVTWPFVMLLLDYWPLQRVSSFKFSVSSPGTASPATCHLQLSTLVFEKLPFFGLAAVMSVVTFLTQKHSGFVLPVEYLPLGARSGNALISYCRYLGKLFWPVNLAVFYPHPGYWPMAQVLLAGALILGITVLFIVKRGRYPYLLMGWLWYCGTLVPVIGLVQAGEVAMADRFTYIPSLGVLVIVIWGAYELTRRWRYQVMALSVAGCAVIVLCCGLTRQQLGYWQDSEVLFRHALAVTANNYLAYHNLGLTLEEKGQTDEAINQYQKAIRLKPDFAKAHNNLGTALGTKGQTDEAISQFQEAIRVKPDFAGFHYNLGTALDRKGQTDEAIRQFQEAIRLKPDYAEAQNNLGVVLNRKGQIKEAISHYQEAIRLKPDFPDAHSNLAKLLATQGKLDEAVKEYQRTLELVSNSDQIHFWYGQALQAQHHFAAAKSEYQKALELNPQNSPVYNNLAWLLATCPDSSLRNGEKAVMLAQEAEQLVGVESPQVLDTLAAAYAEAGRFDKAVETAKRALNLPATQNDKPLAEAIQFRLKLYETNASFHEKP